MASATGAPMAGPRKLGTPTMFSFGIGQAAGAFKNMAWGTLLLFYYQQVVGVDAFLVGLAIAISIVMDAVTDPIIGAWSDRIDTRWGRRHPMLLASTLLYHGCTSLFLKSTLL